MAQDVDYRKELASAIFNLKVYVGCVLYEWLKIEHHIVPATTFTFGLEMGEYPPDDFAVDIPTACRVAGGEALRSSVATAFKDDDFEHATHLVRGCQEILEIDHNRHFKKVSASAFDAAEKKRMSFREFVGYADEYRSERGLDAMIEAMSNGVPIGDLF